MDYLKGGANAGINAFSWPPVANFLMNVVSGVESKAGHTKRVVGGPFASQDRIGSWVSNFVPTSSTLYQWPAAAVKLGRVIFGDEKLKGNSVGEKAGNIVGDTVRSFGVVKSGRDVMPELLSKNEESWAIEKKDLQLREKINTAILDEDPDKRAGARIAFKVALHQMRKENPGLAEQMQNEYDFFKENAKKGMDKNEIVTWWRFTKDPIKVKVDTLLDMESKYNGDYEGYAEVKRNARRLVKDPTFWSAYRKEKVRRAAE